MHTKHALSTTIVPAALLACLSAGPVRADTVWRIGAADDDTADLALGRDGYKRFATDARYVVGRSQAKRDWPYVHPGPADGWAGGRAHTFRIYFALAATPEGPCTFVADLVDTHGRRPPEVAVSVNGRKTVCRLPAGGTDASITGDPSAGKAHRIQIEIPAADLAAGLNRITVANTAGSWFLYDCLSLAGPAALADPPPAAIEEVRTPPWKITRGGRAVREVACRVIRLAGKGPVTVAAGDETAAADPPAGTAARVSLFLPAAKKAAPVTLSVSCGGKTVETRRVILSPARERTPADWVDPLIGTSTSRWMLYPGSSLPFGMVKLSPDNQGHDPARRLWKAGYEYTVENIMGFSHVHAWTMGGLLTMPVTGPRRIDPGPENDPDAGYRSRFDHARETASPGYYAVTLDDYGIRAELTCTTRAGFQRYTYPASGERRILFDLLFPTEYGKKVLDAAITRAGDREIEGYAKMQAGSYAADYQCYTLHFVARTDVPFTSMDGWTKGTIKKDIEKIAGAGDIGAFLNFPAGSTRTVRLQTGISLVSVAQARLNLETEMKPFGWDFDACRGAARRTWNDLLGKIRVAGGRAVDHVKFYTNLYRAYCARTIWSDVNGKYVDPCEKVRTLPDPDSPVYGCDAFWNTFWNLNQLWNLLTPAVSDRWVRSLLEIHDAGGWLPKGPTGIEYSSIMVASHEVPFIVAAWQHGIRGYDAEKAWKAIEHVQTALPQRHPGGGHVGNRDLAVYLKHGYVPHKKGHTSNTMEYAYDDWCAAQLATALGKKEKYKQFMTRAGYWRNLFDTETGFIRPRLPDGTWLEPFDPYRTRGFVEGNAWQYTWFVPQDPAGLVAAMGRERFVRRLDEGMAKSAQTDFNAPGDRMAQVPINHGNQPSMQAAFLFNHAGAPWLTQKYSRAILDRYYGDDPIDGWPGDEDQGQGGAWFVMAAAGLFQVDGGCRVDPVYEIGSPLFERMVIALDGDYYPGEEFVIEAKNNSPDNVYVRSATLNGTPLNTWHFPAKTLQKGGTLVLEMGPEPNRAWGTGGGR